MLLTYRYLVSIIFGCAGVFISVGTINWVIDPHSYFGHNQVNVYVDNDRYVKRALVKERDYNALLLGSSRVASINPDEVSNEDLHFFNAALVAAAPEDILFLLQDIVDDQKVAVIGFDFYMFNSVAEPYRQAWQKDPKALGPWYTYLFKLYTLRASLSAFYSNLRGAEPFVFQNGQRNPVTLQEIDAAYDAPAYEKTLRHVRQKSYAQYEYADQRILIMHQINDLLTKHGVRVIVFINPVNIAIHGLINKMGLTSQFERFKNDVRAVFPDMIDLSVSPWSQPEHFYWTDPWHYRSESGAEIINYILEKHIDPPDDANL